MKTYKFLLICLAIIQFSCTQSPTEPEDKSDGPQKILPEKILSRSGISVLIWSNTTNELIYGGLGGLYAIDLQTKSKRQVAAPTRLLGGNFYPKLSTNGKTLYYIDSPTGYIDGNLCRVSIDGQNYQFLQNNVNRYCLSPTDTHIAYKMGEASWNLEDDSLFIYNVTDKSITFVAIGNPITFSPDGLQFLYGTDLDCYIYTLDSGESEPLSLDMEQTPVNDGSAYYWGVDGILVVQQVIPYDYYSHEGKCIIKNISTDVTLFTWHNKLTSHEFKYCCFTWGADGNKLAYWEPECIDSNWITGTCNTMQQNLHCIDIDSQVDSLTTSGISWSGGSIAFLPDNTKLAYILESSIYMIELP